MIIDFHKKFKKQYIKLNKKIQVKVDRAIDVFKNNPFDPILKNHPLSGKMTGRRAFYVIGDVRIIFKEYKSYTIVLIFDVGTHNQVY